MAAWRSLEGAGRKGVEGRGAGPGQVGDCDQPGFESTAKGVRRETRVDGGRRTTHMKIQEDVIGTITGGFSGEKHPKDAPPPG